MRTILRTMALLLATALLGLGLGAAPASAHSRLIDSSPKDGATVPSSPSELTLTFNENINPEFVTIRVADSEGGEVVEGTPTVAGPVVTIPVDTPIAAGTYSVSYRVVSADSHPIAGKTTFTIEGNPEAPAPSDTTSPPANSSAAPTATTPSSSPEPNAPSSSPEASPEADSGDSASTPVWVWAIVFLALAGAVAATFATVRRDGRAD